MLSRAQDTRLRSAIAARSIRYAKRTPCAVSSHQYACADRANPSRSLLFSSSASGVEIIC
eukprot:5106481-Prymnesium_polylepis.1